MRTMTRLIALFLGATAILHATPPNIVFILTDDLGYGDLSCYGQTLFQTPAIDSLATEGIRFTDHYSGSTVCAPSRACLMTGKDTGHAAIRGNGPFNLPESETTVATLLKRAGYQTAMVGKSCVSGNTQDADVPAKHGFDFFYGTTSHKDAHFRYPEFVYENTRRIDLPDNHLHTGKDYDLDLYTRRSLEWLDGRKTGSPFFLLLSLPAPHASLILPEEKPQPSRSHYTVVENPKDSYMGLVKKIDQTVGSILGKLKERGIDQNTLVLFSSDNGSHSEGGYKPQMLGSSGALRGQKRDLYEGGVRVPFLARWPAVVPPGRASSHPSAFWDFLPTVCETIATTPPAGIQGISYLPTLRGTGTQASHESLYWEFHEMKGRRALRSGDWKIVQYDLMDKKSGNFELYHLADDPAEARNVAGRHPEVLHGLREKIEAARIPNRQFPLPALDR